MAASFGSLPSLPAIEKSSLESDSPLVITLTILFEHSEALISRLAPELAASFRTGFRMSSYPEFVDLALYHIRLWDTISQREFISGHPRIGEKTNLSNLSAKEQGAQGQIPTSETSARLEHLNACYELVYPGLRYITFVNGRSRAEIAKEIEGVLGLKHSSSTSDPPLDELKPVAVDSDEWRGELARAIGDIGRIAHSRLKTLGLN